MSTLNIERPICLRRPLKEFALSGIAEVYRSKRQLDIASVTLGFTIPEDEDPEVNRVRLIGIFWNVLMLE